MDVEIQDHIEKLTVSNNTIALEKEKIKMIQEVINELRKAIPKESVISNKQWAIASIINQYFQKATETIKSEVSRTTKLKSQLEDKYNALVKFLQFNLT